MPKREKFKEIVKVFKINLIYGTCVANQLFRSICCEIKLTSVTKYTRCSKKQFICYPNERSGKCPQTTQKISEAFWTVYRLVGLRNRKLQRDCPPTVQSHSVCMAKR